MARLPAAPPSVGGPRREAWAWAWASVDDLLAAEEIDVVHICTPNATHADLVGRALAAGKHVVCEKPLTTAVAESRRLRDLVGASGLIGTVPFVYRFHPMARELRARLAGARIHVVTGAYLQDWLSRPDDTDWRVESALGGPSRAFGDIGSHLADLVEFVTGDRITWLHALTSTVYDGRGGRPVDTEDLVVVLFRLQRGALGTLTVSQVAPGRKNALTVEIAATDESLRFEQEAPEQLWIGRRHGSELLLRDPGQISPEAARLSAAPAGHPLGFLDAFAGFVGDTYTAIAGQAPDGLPTFTDGLRSAVVVDAVLQSARSGAPVDLEPLPDSAPPSSIGAGYGKE